MELHGTTDDRFSGVADAMRANFDQGLEVGASVCVIHQGRVVADLWAGHREPEKTTPWESDTIVNVWSSTKTMTFLCSLMLADRGELDLFAPVAKYWPEFAANGKDAIEVRNLLSHSAGLSGWSEPMVETDFADWEKCTSLLAAQAPWWEPGTQSGYHAISQGYLIGEVVRRITGETIGTFLRKEVAGPLGADFHIGLDAVHDDRVSNVIPPTPLVPADLDPNSIPMRTFANPPMRAEASATSWWRRAEIPAAGGHGNARAVALCQAALAHGGEFNGVRLLSEAGCNRIFEEQTNGMDLVLGVPVRFGMGYGLNSDLLPLGPNPRSCFWGGWGGSIIVLDLDANLVVSYMMNRMGEGTVGDARGQGILAAAMAAAIG